MKKNSSNSSNSSNNCAKAKSKGNTNQISPAKKWCFTVHNYSKEDIQNLIVPKFQFSIFSEELGESGETPHLQGYIEFKTKVRPINQFENKTIHWEKAKGNREANVNYIQKEGGRHWINGHEVKQLKLITRLRSWQSKLENKLKEPADDRKIMWYYDTEGGTGKSQMCKYLCKKYKCILVEGKASDIKDGVRRYYQDNYHYPDIVLIDIPRCQNEEHVSYKAIESLKNGIFFNTKYETGMCIFNSPHVVIFSNDSPKLGKFSKDRWDIVNLG